MIDSYSKFNILFKNDYKKIFKKDVFFISIFEKKLNSNANSNFLLVFLLQTYKFSGECCFFQIFISFLTSFDPLENANHQIVHYFLTRVLFSLDFYNFKNKF
jgi:hypothetical protein